MRARILVVAIALFAATAAFGGQLSPLRECTIRGVLRPGLCGTLRVLENRDDPDRSRLIDLRVVVFRAQAKQPRPDPIVVIAGGPGQGAVEMAAVAMRQISRVDYYRSVILVDVRGTGESNRLDCPSATFRDEDVFDDCISKLQHHADVRYYTSFDVVDDLEELRVALRVPKVSLLAFSYGTRVAALYVQRYPERVHAAVLRGVVPFTASSTYDTAKSSAAGLAKLVSQCEADEQCNESYPHLRAELAAIERRYAEPPASFRVLNARTGRYEVLRLDFELLHDFLYVLRIDQGSRRRVPQIVHDIATNGPEAFRDWALGVMPGYDDAVAPGVYYSVVCAEDDPLMTDAHRLDLAWTLQRKKSIDRRCSRWPRRPVAPPTPLLQTGVPLLLVSGEDDDATPSDGAQLLAKQLGSALHVVIPGTAHSPAFPGCIARLVREFLDRGSHEGLDTSCVGLEHRLPFFVPAVRPGVSARSASTARSR